MNDIAVSKKDFKLLEEVYISSNGLSAYSLFKRSKYSFSDFIKSVNSLLAKELIHEQSDDFYKVTVLGIKLVTSSRQRDNEKNWRNIPDFMKGEKIMRDSFYTPSLIALDIRSFNIRKGSVRSTDS